MKKGFTLVEMLVVIGIIAVLVAASLVGFSKMTASAERAKLQELVSQTAVAIGEVYNSEGAWPPILVRASKGDGLIDAKIAYYLGSKGLISVTLGDNKETAGLDRFGIVTPWATTVIKRLGRGADRSTPVTGKSTILDHTLRFRIDYDGDGIVEDVPLAGSTVNVRASAVVWSGGKDGTIETYQKGQRKDDVYSWNPGMTKDAN